MPMSWIIDHLLLILTIVGFLSLSGLSLYLWVQLQQELKQPEKIPNKNQIIKDFLNEQCEKAQKLRNSKLFRHPKLNKQACSLRHAYLKIESKIYETQPYNSREYYLQITSHLSQLLKIFDAEHKTKADSDSKLAQKLLQAADETNLTPSSKQQIIQQVKALLHDAEMGFVDPLDFQIIGNRILTLLTQHESSEQQLHLAKAFAISEFNKNSKEHLAKLKAANKDNMGLAEYIHNDEHSLIATESQQLGGRIKALEDENRHLTLQIDFLEQKLASKHSSPYDDDIASSDAKLSQLANQLIEFNEREIRRLKNTTRSQKKIIYDLQQSLDAMNSSPHRLENDSQEQLRDLKNNLDQADTCIAMLEQEVQQLREKLENIQSFEEAHRGDAIKAQIDAITESNKETLEVQHKNDLDFIQEAIVADSLEDLSLLIYQFYLDFKYAPVLLITHKNRQIELCQSGKLNNKVKTTIKSQMPGEHTLDRTTSQLYFQLQYIGGMIQMPARHHSDKELIDVLKMARIADRLIEKLMANQANRQLKKQLESSSNIAKALAKDIESSYDAQIKACKDVVNDHFTRIHNLLRSKNATPTQIASIKQAEQDILEELMANTSFRIKIRREFTSLVKKIEDRQ